MRPFLLLAAAFLLVPSAAVPASLNTSVRPFATAPLAMGASWYPEQWPETDWDADLALMEKAHFRVVRIGEFAWARMEPTDGEFDFAWLDRAIAAATRHGMKVVLGTPTAAPPIWLTEQHPDVRRINADGSVEGHGTRRQFSFASATYRHYAVRIAREMAKRYGHNPNVVGWQIDNEIGVPSFDSEAAALWVGWLKHRYGKIDTLNQRWTTQYWSQVYQRFDQVPLTMAPEQNPALLLDIRRFQSDVWADYVRDQARAIRANADARQFITTNSTIWNNNFNQYRVHEALDMAAWDEYVPDGHPDWPIQALHHDVVRGYKRRNFWIMETQPGWVNWDKRNRALDPGDTRLLAWQAVAHGADAVLYWQWRSARNGQEQYHGTMVGPGGKPMPVYREIAQTAAEFQRAAPILSGTTPVASVALIYSQDSRWAIEAQRFTIEYDPVNVIKDWYRPLAAAGMTVDVLPPDADLSAYRLVLAPNLNVLPGAVAQRLLAWIRDGGHLVLGPRSGMKDIDNALWPQRQPGPLADALGASVEQFLALDQAVLIHGKGLSGSGRIWAEQLHLNSDATRAVAHYASGAWLKGHAVIATRPLGKGSITYVGALLSEKLQAALTRNWVRAAGLAHSMNAHDSSLDVTIRAGTGRKIAVVINPTDHPLPLDQNQFGKVIFGSLTGCTIQARGVLIIDLTGHGNARPRKSTCPAQGKHRFGSTPK